MSEDIIFANRQLNELLAILIDLTFELKATQKKYIICFVDTFFKQVLMEVNRKFDQ